MISFTSDFIPRLVYKYMYSPDGSMHGFVNHTLSYFNVSHFQNGTAPLEPFHLGFHVDICRYGAPITWALNSINTPWMFNFSFSSRYKDYREPPWSPTPYEISKEFWAVLAARLAFVIVFQVSVEHLKTHLSLCIFESHIISARLWKWETHGCSGRHRFTLKSVFGLSK